MKKQTIAIGVAAAALTGGAFVAKHTFSEHPPQSAFSGAPVAGQMLGSDTTTNGTAPKESCTFKVGQQFQFSYRSTTKLQVSPPMPGGPRTSRAESELAGDLSFEVLAAPAKEAAVLLGRLSHANAQAKRLMGDRVEAPFLAKVNARCEVVAFAYHKDTVRPVARVQSVMLHDLAFSIPQADRVEVAFYTSIGIQRAMMIRQVEAGHFIRKPMGYNSRWLPSMTAVDVVGGEVQVQRAGSSWFDSIHGTEEARGGSVDGSMTEWELRAKEVESSVLSNVSKKPTDYIWANVLANDENAPEVKLVGDDATHQRHVEMMRNVTYEQAIERFGASLERGANISEQWPAMAGYLDAHPDRISAYVELITDEQFPAGGKAPAFLALAQARSPVAKQALLGVYRNKDMAPADRMRSSLALVSRADVGIELAKELRKDALRTPSDESQAAVSRQALLHVGVLAGTRPSHGEIVGEAMDLVSELKGNATTPSDYSALCGLVGNMADPRLIPTIAEWSRNPDSDIRAQVPHALRRYKIDMVNDLMVQWLSREKDHAVKRELLNIIRHMHVDEARAVSPEIAELALKHLKEQPPVLNRQSLLHILAPSVGTNVAVREAFKEQLKIEMKERSGLYSLVAEYLPAQSEYEVLSTLPGMANQFRGGIEPLLPTPEPRKEEVPIPSMRLAVPGDYPPGTMGGTP